MPRDATRRGALRTFNAAAVLRDTLGLFFRNFAPIVGIALAIFLPIVAFRFYQAVQILGGDPVSLEEGVASWVITGVEWLILRPLVSAIIVYALFHALMGQPVSFGRSAAAGLRRLPAVVGTSILKGLIIAAPFVAISVFLLLIVIGQGRYSGPRGSSALAVVGVVAAVVASLAVMTIYYIAEPAVVVEKAGPRRALDRSKVLTRGSRLPLFGLILLFSLLGFGAGQMALLAGRLASDVIASPLQVAAVSIILMELLEVILQGLNAVLITVTYYHARCAKEHLDVEKLAGVFDT